MRRFVITLVIAAGRGGRSGSVARPPAAVEEARSPRLVWSARCRRSSRTFTPGGELLGHQGVTPASLHPKAMCDKRWSANAGGHNWDCLLSWTDTNIPMPSAGYGKFEVNAHSNECYTAGSPS